MAEFVNNNTKNTNTSHKFFELNYSYHPRVFFQNEADLYSKYYSANQLAKGLMDLIFVCQQNLFHIQEFQKQAYNKDIIPYSNIVDKKV